VVQSIADKYRGSGVEVIGLSLDDAVPGNRAETKRRLAQFLQKRGIHFANVYYIGSPAELTDQLHSDGSIPITIVFDKNGRELARNEGKLDRVWFEKQLDQLTKRKSQ
jgi:hypothetical protein